MQSSGASLLNKTKSNIFKPKPKQKIWEWVEENCVIPASTGSQYVGKLNTGRTPFFREIYDAYQRQSTRKVILVAPTQIGKTLTSYALIAHTIRYGNHPILYATSNEKNAKRVSNDEMMPFLKACKDIEHLFSSDRRHNTTLEIRFKSCSLGLIGVQSPSNTASRPVCNVFCDEVDKWPESGAREARAIDLIEARLHSFPFSSKMFMSSTPTVPNGAIWQEYLKGNQCRFHVPCPNCVGFQELHFFWSKSEGGILWPDSCQRKSGAWDLDKIQAEVYYECKFCHAKIPDSKRISMIDNYKSVVGNPNAPRDTESFQVSALYSLRGWGTLAKMYMESKESMTDLQHFYNSTLALPWTPSESVVTIQSLKKIQEKSIPYKLGELPFKPHVMIMGIDVQMDSCYWVVRAFRDDKVSALVDYGQVMNLDDLQEIFRREYKFEEKNYDVFKACIDSGYRTSEIYDYIINKAGRYFIPTKGSHSGLVAKVFKWGDPIEFKGRRIDVLKYDDELLKESLYLNAGGETENWMLPSFLGKEYYDQMTCEVRVGKRLESGQVEYSWQLQGKYGNHYADCEKLCELFLISNSGIFSL